MVNNFTNIKKIKDATGSLYLTNGSLLLCVRICVMTVLISHMSPRSFLVCHVNVRAD